MTKPIPLRLGGYGPSTTCFSLALKRIGDRIKAEFGDEVDIKYVWNVMDLGYKAEDLLWLVEDGLLTLSYQSSSYFTSRAPALEALDLPFVFRSNEEARAAMDGALGAAVSHALEDNMNYRILGYFENGFRHVSNKLRPVRSPADLAGMRIRVLPSRIQARTFELLGATPLVLDLTEAIKGVVEGNIDAQENPFANTVTYGVHKFHRFHTKTNHSYLSRPVFLNRTQYDGFPPRLREALAIAVRDAVAYQRELGVEEDRAARAQILAQGCEILELSAAEHERFKAAVKPLYAETRAVHKGGLMDLLPGLGSA